MGGSEEAAGGTFYWRSTASEREGAGKARQAVMVQASGRGQVRARLAGSGDNGAPWVRVLREEATMAPCMAKRRKGHAVLGGAAAACQSRHRA